MIEWFLGEDGYIQSIIIVVMIGILVIIVMSIKDNKKKRDKIAKETQKQLEKPYGKTF